MGRINLDEVDNYGGNGNGYFSLKNDKDTAVVRFMHKESKDLVPYAVHEVMIDGRKRYVNCIRNYDQPVDDCPLCAAKTKLVVKIFIFLYDINENVVKIWDRGKGFISWMGGLFDRYSPLSDYIFEIERQGKKNDPKTNYVPFLNEKAPIELSDLPEMPEPLGTIILDKNFEELQFFVKNGYFEGEAEKGETSRASSRQPERDSAAPRRRVNAVEDSAGQPVGQQRRPATDRY